MQRILTSRVVLGRAIREARRKKGLSQAQLGRLIKIAQANISEIEKGLYPSTFDTILRITSALDLEISLAPKLKNKNTDW